MSERPFVHLHCHSHYSLLDGAADIGKLVKRAKEHGMNSLALTDHGNLHGALEFYRKAKDGGINPIIGYEAYIAPGSRHERGNAGSSKEASYHLTLLAQNRTGFRNLVKLASAASLEGFYFKPRIDKEILKAHSEGIICLSGCVSSEFSRTVLRGIDTAEVEKEARDVAGWFHKVFRDRYFIEVMNNGAEIQRLQLEGAVEMANRMGLPLVTTSDTHYVNQDDAEAQDIMCCISTGKFRTDTARMKMDSDQYFLRSPAQMYEKFPGLEHAVERSQEIANTVDIDLQLGKHYFPGFDCPQAAAPIDYLRDLCIKGLLERYEGDAKRIIDGKLSDEVVARLERELGVIEKLGYPTYFLIVWDFVNHARTRGIWATARGSGVGAIVCYALYMSHVCPLQYDLLFERFLDESRIEPPDIDIDFDKDRRGEIIQYVKDKYGHENVCQIGTFGTLAARAAIKDTGRALGIPLAEVNRITEMVPEELKITLAMALEKSDELKRAYDNDPEIREMLDLAMRIEGLARNVGTHADAVVIADKPLTEYVPLCRVSGKQDVITQWSMGDVEAAGLLKMDFLGLRNLTILSKAVELIEQTTGKRIDPLKFPLDDKKTYALLQRGETKGVFQLESGGIRDLLQRMKPDQFTDIIATNALYRPGPLEGGMVDDFVNIKHGRQQPEYKHPVIKEVLGETNSIMVYQEQVMRILNRLGGIPLAAAYTVIKAISKKKESLINQNREKFLEGSVANGLSKSDAEDIWSLIQKFAGYGFNKCVVGGTMIFDAHKGEQTTVEELFSSRREFHIHAIGDDLKLRPRRVTNVVWNGVVQTYTVTTTGGRHLTATANHPLRTPTGWMNIDELGVGDEIAAVEVLPVHGDTLLPSNGAVMRESCGLDHPVATLDPTRVRLNVASENIHWDRIVAIDVSAIEDVYDLTVEHDHNYLAGGLVVHNSHSTAYALVAYQTAYLKAHYPVEFMAALLSSDITGRNFKRKDALVEHMEDCDRMGIEVVAPDVNQSHADFAVQDGKILFAMSAIKGCGGSAAEAIVAARRSGEPFADLFEFCERVDVQACGRAAIETLVKAGAMDSLGGERGQLTTAIDRALQVGAAAMADRKSGQASLFGMFEEESQPTKDTKRSVLPEVPPWTEKQKLLAEKEVLGFYLASHPMAEYEPKLSAFRSHTTDQLGEIKERAEVLLGGMIGSVKFAHTKNGKPGTPTKYANFDLEDMQGVVRCILWPKQFADQGEAVQADAVVLARGVCDRRGGGDEVNLIINELIPLNQLDSKYTRGIRVELEQNRHNEETFTLLREIIRGYPGYQDFLLSLRIDSGETIHIKSSKYQVEVTAEMRSRLDDLLGAGGYRLMMTRPQVSSGGGGRR